MKHLCSLIVLVLVGLSSPARAGSAARTLVYPELEATESEPPALRLDGAGAPLTLFFPGALLDARPEVHLISAPEHVELRVAERAAYLLALGALPPESPIILTLTLEGGRPLAFRLLPATGGAVADNLVEVHLPAAVREAECPVRLAVATDALATCQEQTSGSGVELVGKLLARADPDAGAASVRSVGWRNKEHHLFLEVVDVLHLGAKSFVRLVVENRDPRGPRWRPGEIRVQTDDTLDPRRLAVDVVTSVEAIAPRERMVIVVIFDSPQLPANTQLQVVIPEEGGKRHLKVGGL